MSQKDTKTVTYSPPSKGAPSLSKAELETIDRLADAGGDAYYADLPELDAAFFAKAKRIANPHNKPQTKSRVTLRLDEDILAWLKESGPGYQTRVNAILRLVMEEGDK